VSGVLEQILDEVRALRAEVAELRGLQQGGMVSIAEYARMHGVCTATVRAAIKAGRLGVVRNGRAWRVRSDEQIAADKSTEEDADFALRLVGGGR
jgi:hypothetical protein